MSFGFSAGDFLAAGQLIKDIITSLRSAGGAKSEYQELTRQLNSLDLALQHLDRLKATSSTASNIDSIKFTALSCRHPLSEFLAKIRKYDNSLGVWSKSNTAKSTVDKLKFTFAHPDEIRKLQTYLSVHIGTINILLAEHGLDIVADIAMITEAQYADVREQLQTTQKILGTIQQSMPAQTFLLQKIYSMLIDLSKLMTGELSTSWYRFGRMISSICVSTQQIYTVVVDIRDRQVPLDTRMTYFQAPLVIEDALGCKFPVPSEYDFDMLNTIVRQRFKSGPGHRNVRAGNYELCNASNRSVVLTEGTRLFPGMSVRMAIIMPVEEIVSVFCPMPHCESSEAQSFPGGGFTCIKCHVWFDKSSKNRVDLKTLLEVLDAQEEITSDVQIASTSPHDKKREADDIDAKEEYNLLRNVVWAVKIKEANLDPEEDHGVQYEDALAYIDELKEATRLIGKPHIYREFLDLMQAYQEEHLSVGEVVLRWLSYGNDLPQFMLRFNQFLLSPRVIVFDPDSGAWLYRDGDGISHQAKTDLDIGLEALADFQILTQ